MITTVALDLVGVLVKEKDINLNSVEERLERHFGQINFNDEYYQFAQEELGLDKPTVNELVVGIFDQLYELRDPRLFDKLTAYRLVLATNHISIIKEWFRKNKLSQNFYQLVISADVGYQKPDHVFYDKLVQECGTAKDEILFVDDSLENITSAQEFGIHAMHFNNRSEVLSEAILKYISSLSLKN